MIVIAKLTQKTLNVVHLSEGSKHLFVCASRIDGNLVCHLRAAYGGRILYTECKTELFEEDLDAIENIIVNDQTLAEVKPGVFVLGEKFEQLK